VKKTIRFERLSNKQRSWRANQKPKAFKVRDLFGALLDARDSELGKGYTREKLIGESGLLIVAGSDTMATDITSTIFYILQYSDTYERLKAETVPSFLIWKRYALASSFQPVSI
jgi:cytochrome P450